jgi:hypothetical protein
MRAEPNVILSHNKTSLSTVTNLFTKKRLHTAIVYTDSYDKKQCRSRGGAVPFSATSESKPRQDVAPAPTRMFGVHNFEKIVLSNTGAAW